MNHQSRIFRTTSKLANENLYRKQTEYDWLHTTTWSSLWLLYSVLVSVNIMCYFKLTQNWTFNFLCAGVVDDEKKTHTQAQKGCE